MGAFDRVTVTVGTASMQWQILCATALAVDRRLLSNEDSALPVVVDVEVTVVVEDSDVVVDLVVDLGCVVEIGCVVGIGFVVETGCVLEIEPVVERRWDPEDGVVLVVSLVLHGARFATTVDE